MSTADPTPGADDATFPDNDRSFLADQAPVEVDGAAVAENTDALSDAAADGDEPGADADAARA